MKQPIKNIIFDFGGVIVGINKDNAVRRFKEIGFAAIEDYLNEFRQKGIFLEYEEGKINSTDFYNEFRKLAGKPEISDNEIDSGWMAFLTGIPAYKFELLKELRTKYKLYLLSNTNPSVMKWAFSSHFSPEGLPIGSYFDKCYLSYQMGITKPDQKIFEILQSDARINPEESLFLDDGIKNVEMAQQIGFNTYQANQDEDLKAFFTNSNLL